MSYSDEHLHSDAMALLAAASHDGPLWSIASEQLNANIIRLSAGQIITEHVNGIVDVLIVVLAGQGQLLVNGATYELAAGRVVLVPRGTHRSIVSQSDALAYVTCHVRRAGLLPT